MLLVAKEVDGVEVGVLDEGTPFLTGRGLAKACGLKATGAPMHVVRVDGDRALCTWPTFALGAVAGEIREITGACSDTFAIAELRPDASKVPCWMCAGSLRWTGLDDMWRCPTGHCVTGQSVARRRAAACARSVIEGIEADWVEIQRIEVETVDPDRFVFGLSQAFASAASVRSPTADALDRGANMIANHVDPYKDRTRQ